MTPPINSHSVHSVIEHLTGLTSQSDLELLTISLLKSLTGLIRRSKVRVITLNQRLEPIRQYSYTNDNVEVTYDRITIDPRVKSTLVKVHDGNLKQFSQDIDNQVLSIYLLHHDRQSTSYLMLATNRSLTHAEDYLVSGVLEIFKNFSNLLITAQTDELTGLANRKTFESAISRIYEFQPEREILNTGEQRADIESAPYWLCAIDVDHFKSVNDNYGHLFGDEVLIRLAQIMRSEFRSEDLLFRFGGEEFIVLLRAPGRETADIALERFRAGVEGTSFSGVGQITVSVGAVAVDPSVFYKTLMDYADQALYHSKHNGRNRITFFEDLLDQGLARIEEIEEGTIDLF